MTDESMPPPFEEMLAAIYAMLESTEDTPHRKRHDLVVQFATDIMGLDFAYLVTGQLTPEGNASLCCTSSAHPDMGRAYGIIASKLRGSAAALDAQKPADGGAVVLADSSKPGRGVGQA